MAGQSEALYLGPEEPCKETPLPKRNYGFEKRQKELARKQKKEEKMQRRLERTREAPEDSTSDLPTPTEPQPEE